MGGFEVNENIYFITRQGLDKSSDRLHLTYDEAKDCVAKDREECEKKGVKSELCQITQVDVEKHNKSIRKLIDAYHKSNSHVEDPMVVLFSQSKQYAIMPEKELTPALWLERPYVVYGAVEQMEG